MLHVIEVQLHHAYALWLRFNDGAEGLVDLAAELEGTVFAPLRDPALFAQVAVDQEIGTVVWPNGADFAPEFLRGLMRETVEEA